MAFTEFGRDTSCTTSLRTGRFVTGARLVGEAIFRRLTTPRGMLRGGEDEANYGLDLLDLIGSATTDADKAALPGRIQGEVKKDERTERVTVDVTSTQDGSAVSWVIAVTALTGLGPFTLQIGINDVTIELLGLTVGSS